MSVTISFPLTGKGYLNGVPKGLGYFPSLWFYDAPQRQYR